MSGKRATKRVNLALQGGGAHGAYTWGALDRLLQEDAVEIEGITATSAGAMNAAALKSGFHADGRAGARSSLDAFWLGVAGLDGYVTDAMLDWLRAVAPAPAVTARVLEMSPIALATEAVTRVLSPYQFNPANFHPLRALVEGMFNYDHVCSESWPKLFVCATNVRSGKIKVFRGQQISAEAILASACLPTLYQAIEVVDPDTGRLEAYWDGGYSGNPALYPLFYHTSTPDTIIVHINPLERDELPHTTTEILNRINEISFNSTLLRELRAIEFVHRLIQEGKIPRGEMMDARIHSVKDDELMRQLGVATKTTPNRGLLLQLKAAGQASMDRFLTDHWKDIGETGTVNLRKVIES